MEHELFIKELKASIYLFDEAHMSSGYLVVGEKKACLIDTMNGYNNLYEAIRKITDKPIVVVNTHGHPDHIFGNVYFDKAFMNPADNELAESFKNIPEFADACKKYGLSMPPFSPIDEGDIIDLGGKTLEIYNIPGHTQGSILLLLKEDRILFVGDSINHHLWMQVPGATKMDDFVKSLDRIMFLEEKADFILHGHANDFDDISLIRCLRQGALEICQGKTQDDKPYNWFGGIALQHPFSLEKGKQYSQTDSVICYNR